MKHIITLFTALMLVAAASQNSSAQAGGNKPFVSPNPAHDYLKVNWMQNQCDNVIITMYYANGTFARTLQNRQYCEGTYSQIFKVLTMTRGSYIMRVQVGGQVWSYKILLQ
jgi:hypothetical protein